MIKGYHINWLYLSLVANCKDLKYFNLDIVNGKHDISINLPFQNYQDFNIYIKRTSQRVYRIMIYLSIEKKLEFYSLDRVEDIIKLVNKKVQEIYANYKEECIHNMQRKYYNTSWWRELTKEYSSNTKNTT